MFIVQTTYGFNSSWPTGELKAGFFSYNTAAVLLRIENQGTNCTYALDCARCMLVKP